MRFPSILLGLLLLLATLNANTSMQYPQDGLLVVRTLEVQQVQTVNTVMGVGTKSLQSVITLTLSNPGSVSRHNVILSEDVTYLPSYIRLTYSTQPTSTDGRTVSWTLPDLPAGQSARYTITLPVAISDAPVASAPAPRLTSDRPSAQLVVPTLSDAGQNVVLRLRANDGTALSNARIEVSAPNGQHLSLLTDGEGRAYFMANSSGFYTYSIPDFAVAFAPATEVRAPTLVLPPTASAIVALPSANASASSVSAPFQFPNIDLSGLWPVAGGLLLVGLAAFSLYAYFNRSQPEDYSTPLPPAPSSRPYIHDMQGFGSSPSDSGPVAARAGTDENDSSSLGMPKSPSIPSSSNDARSASPELSSSGTSVVSTTAANMADSPAIRARTRELISARRSGKPLSSSPAAAPSSNPFSSSSESASLSGSSSATSPDAAKPVFPSDAPAYSEQTQVSPGFGDEEDSDEDEDSDESPGAAGADDSSPSSSRPVPSWMKRTASPQSETAEVDDEAIAKTISELEALRDELRARSTSRQKSGSSSALDASSSSDAAEEPETEELGKAVALSSEEKAEMDAILSATPAYVPAPSEDETRVDEEAQISSTKEEASESSDSDEGDSPAPAAPIIRFTPSNRAPAKLILPKLASGKPGASAGSAPAVSRSPGRPRKEEAKPVIRPTKPPKSEIKSSSPAKPTWSVVKSASIAQRATRAVGRPKKEVKAEKSVSSKSSTKKGRR